MYSEDDHDAIKGRDFEISRHDSKDTRNGLSDSSEDCKTSTQNFRDQPTIPKAHRGIRGHEHPTQLQRYPLRLPGASTHSRWTPLADYRRRCRGLLRCRGPGSIDRFMRHHRVAVRITGNHRRVTAGSWRAHSSSSVLSSGQTSQLMQLAVPSSRGSTCVGCYCACCGRGLSASTSRDARTRICGHLQVACRFAVALTTEHRHH